MDLFVLCLFVSLFVWPTNAEAGRYVINACSMYFDQEFHINTMTNLSMRFNVSEHYGDLSCHCVIQSIRVNQTFNIQHKITLPSDFNPFYYQCGVGMFCRYFTFTTCGFTTNAVCTARHYNGPNFEIQRTFNTQLWSTVEQIFVFMRWRRISGINIDLLTTVNLLFANESEIRVRCGDLHVIGIPTAIPSIDTTTSPSSTTTWPQRGRSEGLSTEGTTIHTVKQYRKGDTNNSNKHSTAIGVGIGVPLIFVLIVALALLVYVIIKRRNTLKNLQSNGNGEHIDLSVRYASSDEMDIHNVHMNIGSVQSTDTGSHQYLTMETPGTATGRDTNEAVRMQENDMYESNDVTRDNFENDRGPRDSRVNSDDIVFEQNPIYEPS